jgi:sulfite exporter TauE/SafE
MELIAPLIVGALLGLVNGAHCAGMCGAFAVRATIGSGGQGAFLRFGKYALGKLFTYTFLGALVGALGQGLFLVAKPVQAVVGVGVAILMIVAGARMFGFASKPTALGSFIAARLAGIVRSSMDKGPFAVGAVTGVLPCGVVYLALAQAAATGTTVQATVVMVGLGLGTAPSLALVAFGTQSLVRVLGAQRMRIASGCLLVLVGLFTAWRALAPYLLESSEGAAACCH